MSLIQDLFLMLDNVNVDEHVNVLERFYKGDILYTFTKT